MLGIVTEDLKHTRFAQEMMMAEDCREARQEGAVRLLLLQLSRRLGPLSEELQQHIRQWSEPQLETLGSRIFEIEGLEQLERLVAEC